MKTVLSIVMLIIFGSIALFLLAIAGLPGALLTLKSKWRSRGRIIIGSIISTLGQSYIYLAYVAFIISWTTLASRRNDVVGFLLWPVAFIAVASPVVANLIHAYGVEEERYAKANIVGSYITLIVSLVGFFVFAFVPTVTRTAWHWVPYNHMLFEEKAEADKIIRANVDSFFYGLYSYTEASQLSYAFQNSKDKADILEKFKTSFKESKAKLLKCDRRLMNSIYNEWGNVIYDKFIASIDLYLSGVPSELLRGEALRLEGINWIEKNMRPLFKTLKQKYGIDENKPLDQRLL